MYSRNMGCFRYVIVNTLHKVGNKDNGEEEEEEEEEEKMIMMIMMIMKKKKKKKKKMMMMMMMMMIIIIIIIIKYSVGFAKKVSVEELERNRAYRTLDVNEMTILK